MTTQSVRIPPSHPEFVVLPEKRSLNFLASGKIAAAIPLVEEPNFNTFADFGGELTRDDYVFISRFDYPEADIRSGLKYGFLRPHVGERLIPDYAASKVDAGAPDQLISMLDLGRIDIALVRKAQADRLIQRFEGTFHIHSAGSVITSLYVSRHHRRTGVFEELQQAIELCRKVG